MSILDTLMGRLDPDDQPRDQQLISTDISVQVAPNEAPDDRPPRRWQQRAAERQQAATDFAQLLSQLNAHFGALQSALKAPPPSDVLAQQTAVIPAAGFFTLPWPAGFQSVTVANTSANPLSVTGFEPAPGAAPPNAGAGLFLVRPGICRTSALRGNVLTIYGLAGSVFDFVIFSRPRPPASGPC